MNWKHVWIRKLLVMIVLSLGIMPLILTTLFTDAFVGYITGVFLSAIGFTFFGLPCSIASEWITLKFKKIMLDFHPRLAWFVTSGTYITLHICFGLLLSGIVVLGSPFLWMGSSIIFCIIIACLLFVIFDLIIGFVQKRVLKWLKGNPT